MWIRSQDKRILVDTRRIVILAPNRLRKKWEIANFESMRPVQEDTCEDYDILGEYDTEEDCKVILDHMEKSILKQAVIYGMATQEELRDWIADKARS